MKIAQLRGLMIGGIGYLACILGLVQYWMTGKISTRPGYKAMEGETAIFQLIFIGSISSLFCGLGIFSNILEGTKQETEISGP